jgi:hypothetical protein
MACLREFVRARMQGQNSSFARPQRRAFRPLARRDVIYTIMSDEQQRQRPKGLRSLRVAAKIAAGFGRQLQNEWPGGDLRPILFN